MIQNLPYSIVISGPTASGKTALSLQLAEDIERELGIKCQIVNADIGQFYTPLFIGTAKPDLKNMPIRHHLFDVISKPLDLNVVVYRKMVLDIVHQIHNEGSLPIIVGGSLFYLRSLLFPPTSQETTPSPRSASDRLACDGAGGEGLWEKLHAIDPERAASIHPHDIYRIERALRIYETTGNKPSSQEPIFDPPFHSRIIFIDQDRDILYQRINLRTEQMIRSEGWIEEAKRLQGSPWEQFLKSKRLIGYPEIFAWLERGENTAEIPKLIEEIQQKTRQYAKRQITFWKKFRNILGSACKERTDLFCETEVIKDIDNKNIKAIIEHIKGDLSQGMYSGGTCSRGLVPK